MGLLSRLVAQLAVVTEVGELGGVFLKVSINRKLAIATDWGSKRAIHTSSKSHSSTAPASVPSSSLL